MDETQELAAPEDQESLDPEIAAQQQALVEEEQEIRIQVSAEHVNLVESLDDQTRQKIARQVIETTRTDLESRTEWDEKRAHWVRLFYQTDFENVGGMTWAACESLPILTEACNAFAVRTQKAFFSKPEFIGAKVVQFRQGQKLEQLRERAERVGRHLNWQLTYKMRDYRSDKTALFLATAIHGSYFTKTYFNPIKKQNVVDNISAADFVVPYTIGPVSIADLPRYTQICRENMQNCRHLTETGFFAEMPKAAGDLELTPDQLAYKEAEGTNQPSAQDQDDASGMALLLEQYLYLDIDGEWKPYIATVDKTSNKLIRLAINYEATPTGADLSEGEDYQRVEYFTHYKFLDNPDGFYGYGYGHLLGDINSAVNVMLRQTLDAATLQNDGNCSGFISADIADDSEELQMEIGRFKKLGTTVANIREKIYTMDFKGPSAALIELMQLLDGRGQRLGSITEATTGSSTTVKQPTTVITEVEQALELLSSVQLGISRSMSEELWKIYRLNRLYMPAIDYFVTNDAPEQVAISDYADDMLVEPVFDPRFSSQAQRLALAQAELQAVLQNPNSAMRPQIIDLAFKNYLTAVGSDKVDEYFPEAPEPEQIDDQEIENAYFLLPPNDRPPFDVFPDQDHALHIAQLDQFIADYALQLDEQTLLMVQDHKRKHLAYQYMRDKAGATGPIGPAAMQYGQLSPELLSGINMSMFGNGVSDGGQTQ